MQCRLRTDDAKFELFILNNEVLFIQKEKDDIIIPHLKLLHKYPDMMPKM
jgi:predicted ribosome-associated RNA-binding protein Tma20